MKTSGLGTRETFLVNLGKIDTSRTNGNNITYMLIEKQIERLREIAPKYIIPMAIVRIYDGSEKKMRNVISTTDYVKIINIMCPESHIETFESVKSGGDIVNYLENEMNCRIIPDNEILRVVPLVYVITEEYRTPTDYQPAEPVAVCESRDLADKFISERGDSIKTKWKEYIDFDKGWKEYDYDTEDGIYRLEDECSNKWSYCVWITELELMKKD